MADNNNDYDDLYVGLTRPPMWWGVSLTGFMFNLIAVLMFFVFTKNPLHLLIGVPIHLVMVLLCKRDPRVFDLLIFWMKTKGRNRSSRNWNGSTYRN